MLTVSVLLAIFWVIPVLIQCVSAYLTRRHFNSVPVLPDTPFRLIPVSILKPLKGVDEGLEENLRSFFTLDYPEYEILFSVADPNDPARRVAERLMSEYPHISTKFLVGDLQVGLNPKINNLVRSYEKARFAWILISDSNVRVEDRYLKNLVSQVDNDTGMLTSVVLGTEAQGFGARLEAMYLNTFNAKGMILAAAAHQDCVVGKSMLFRKSSADRFGGLRALGNYLAEDYMAGEAMKHLGLKVKTAWHPVPQYLGRASFKSFWNRHVRWGRIRKTQAPIAFVAEALGSSLVSGLIGLPVIPNLLGIDPALFLALHLTLWFCLDFVVLRTVKARLDFRILFDWLVRELLAFPIWIRVCAGNTVEWRGVHYVLGAGGILTPLPDSR